MTNTLPFPLGATFYPKAPESVKKIFPVLFDKIIEFGPSNWIPSYSLTSSAYDPSLELTAMTDCLSKSAT